MNENLNFTFWSIELSIQFMYLSYILQFFFFFGLCPGAGEGLGEGGGFITASLEMDISFTSLAPQVWAIYFSLYTWSNISFGKVIFLNSPIVFIYMGHDLQLSRYNLGSVPYCILNQHARIHNPTHFNLSHWI